MHIYSTKSIPTPSLTQLTPVGDGDRSLCLVTLRADKYKRRVREHKCIDDAVTHVTLPGHFPRPGPDLRGARGIAPGVAGGRRGVERETIVGISDCGRKRLRAQVIAS